MASSRCGLSLLIDPAALGPPSPNAKNASGPAMPTQRPLAAQTKEDIGTTVDALGGASEETWSELNASGQHPEENLQSANSLARRATMSCRTNKSDVLKIIPDRSEAMRLTYWSLTYVG